MTLTTYIHDPDAVLDYSVDFTAWLDSGETITAHAVTVPTGLVLATSSVTGGLVTAWLAGGTTGTTYTVGYRITTSDGRTDERSIRIRVSER